MRDVDAPAAMVPLPAEPPRLQRGGVGAGRPRACPCEDGSPCLAGAAGGDGGLSGRWDGGVAGRGLAVLREAAILGDGAIWTWHLADAGFADRQAHTLLAQGVAPVQAALDALRPATATTDAATVLRWSNTGGWALLTLRAHLRSERPLTPATVGQAPLPYRRTA